MYLHDHPNFTDLLGVIEQETGIIPVLIEKDYWLMHVLYGLTQQGFDFQLKGGTSLSKGYGIIHRFSEDIDIYIKPDPKQGVEENATKRKPQHLASRENYFNHLAGIIKVPGIVSVERDKAFDDPAFRSGGIRLHYNTLTEFVTGVKPGILLEAGFDTVTPFNRLTISSWAYDKAATSVITDLTDNRAVGIACYHPGYTFVEKLQTIATKFRQENERKVELPNLMRQYYDVYSLLGNKEVQEFVGTDAYLQHKKKRFPPQDFEIPLAENEAFLLSSPAMRDRFKERYALTAGLYYQGQPPFDDVLQRIADNITRL